MSLHYFTLFHRDRKPHNALTSENATAVTAELAQDLIHSEELL